MASASISYNSYYSRERTKTGDTCRVFQVTVSYVRVGKIANERDCIFRDVVAKQPYHVNRTEIVATNIDVRVNGHIRKI